MDKTATEIMLDRNFFKRRGSMSDEMLNAKYPERRNSITTNIIIWDVVTSSASSIIHISHKACSLRDIENDFLLFMKDLGKDFWIKSGKWNIESFTDEISKEFIREDSAPDVDILRTKFHFFSVSALLKSLLWCQRNKKEYGGDVTLTLMIKCIVGILGQYIMNCDRVTLTGDVINAINTDIFGSLNEKYIEEMAQYMLKTDWSRYNNGCA